MFSTSVPFGSIVQMQQSDEVHFYQSCLCMFHWLLSIQLKIMTQKMAHETPHPSPSPKLHLCFLHGIPTNLSAVQLHHQGQNSLIWTGENAGWLKVKATEISKLTRKGKKKQTSKIQSVFSNIPTWHLIQDLFHPAKVTWNFDSTYRATYHQSAPVQGISCHKLNSTKVNFPKKRNPHFRCMNCWWCFPDFRTSAQDLSRIENWPQHLANRKRLKL